MVGTLELPIKVLYVEDDLVDQKAFERFVKNGQHNLQYDVASSVSQAKKYLHNNLYDVVVTDYLLNHETGFSVFESVDKTPLIFLTGQGDQDIAVKAMKKGAFDYIVKESTGQYLDLLLNTIEKAHSQTNTNKKLQEAEKEIKKLLWTLSQINNSIMIINCDGEIEWVNKGFEQLFGHRFEEVKNKSIWDFRRKDLGKGKSSELFKRLLRKKGSLTCESKMQKNNGETCWIYTTITSVENESGNVSRIIIVDTDITEKKKIEEELIKAKEKAEAAAVTKQQFLANMSHEIRTPVNAIMGLMHMLETTEHSETRKKYMELVNHASTNLLNIINDILDISKLDVGKMTAEKVDFNIRDLVLNLKRSIQYRAEEKGLEIVFKMDNKIPANLKGDPSRLSQILINLLGNAIKFTEKGLVSITLKKISEKNERVKILFTVADTGIGIAEKAQSQIFEYFYQVNSDSTRKYGGTGLGLAIVKRLTELQNGKVWFKSKENEGSQFFVELEFEKGKNPEKTLSEKQPALKNLFLRGKRILLAEDEAMNQLVAKHILENELGAMVDVAANGRIAIEKLEKTNYDLVIMDIQMPEMNGYDTTHHIRTKFANPKKNVPILAMTAHAFKEEEKKCEEAGMNGFLSKPFKIDELKQKIDSLINEKHI